MGDRGLCLGVVWGDFNDDGRPDLYVVNDFGRKTLYHNNGDGTFTDVTVKSNSLAYGAGMSASFADYDNDSRFDYYVTHIRSEHAWFAESPTVKRYMLKCLMQGTGRPRKRPSASIGVPIRPAVRRARRSSGGRLQLREGSMPL